jgi:WD40 repeat protein
VKSLEGHQGWVTSLAFSSDSQWLLSGGFDDTVRIWDVQQLKLVKQFEDHTQWVRCVTFAPDQAGRFAVSAGNAGCLQLWNTGTVMAPGPRLGQPLQWHMISSAAISSDGQLLAATGWSKTVRLWETRTGRLLAEIPGHAGTIYDLAWCGSARLLTASADQTLRLWDIRTGRELKRYIGHENAVRSVSLSADLQTIASAGEDGTVCLWPGEPDQAAANP